MQQGEEQNLQVPDGNKQWVWSY